MVAENLDTINWKLSCKNCILKNDYNYRQDRMLAVFNVNVGLLLQAGCTNYATCVPHNEQNVHKQEMKNSTVVQG